MYVMYLYVNVWLQSAISGNCQHATEVQHTHTHRYETKMPERFGGYVGAYLNDGLHAKVCVL